MSDTPDSGAAPHPCPPPSPAPPAASPAAPAAPGLRDRVLLVVFCAWAALLVVATLAQIFGWQGVLDALDVKRWFAR
jgi:hypothetical protein